MPSPSIEVPGTAMALRPGASRWAINRDPLRILLIMLLTWTKLLTRKVWAQTKTTLERVPVIVEEDLRASRVLTNSDIFRNVGELNFGRQGLVTITVTVITSSAVKWPAGRIYLGQN